MRKGEVGIVTRRYRSVRVKAKSVAEIIDLSEC